MAIYYVYYEYNGEMHKATRYPESYKEAEERVQRYHSKYEIRRNPEEIHEIKEVAKISAFISKNFFHEIFQMFIEFDRMSRRQLKNEYYNTGRRVEHAMALEIIGVWAWEFHEDCMKKSHEKMEGEDYDSHNNYDSIRKFVVEKIEDLITYNENLKWDK